MAFDRSNPVPFLVEKKIGDTFSISFVANIDQGALVTAVECTISDLKTFSFALTVAPLGLNVGDGRYYWSISATAAQTSLWPLGVLSLDIKKTLSSGIDTTKTFMQKMLPRVTP